MKGLAIWGWLTTLGMCFALGPVAVAETAKDQPADVFQSRTFRLNYGATLTDLPTASGVRVWLPVPPSNEDQKVKRLKSNLPAASRISTEPIHGNQILYFETNGPASGRVAFETSYLVQRREVRGLAGDGGKAKLISEQRRLLLSANKKIPLQGKHLDLLDGVPLSRNPVDMARILYDRVDDQLRYDKSKPGYGNGDVLWVCDSRCGNCSDFHSLFIAWARANGLPARFEIGFPVPPERGEGTISGYHCWALFHSDENGWVPVDISEADKHPEMKEYFFGNLTEDRVAFTTGRDIVLVPKQDGEPLNYFVYPYVEVDGKPWPAENVKLSVTYADENEKRVP